MNRHGVKILALFIFFTIHKLGFSQLNLETIFLENKYAENKLEDIQFVHTKSQFAILKSSDKGKVINFYSTQNELQQTIYLSLFQKEAVINTDKLNNLQFSNLDKHFLVSNSCSQLYRYSKSCNYLIGNVSGKFTSLSDAAQFYPTFSPNDKYIAFVKGNDLFYKTIESNTETKITQDGEWNKIINGKSDWVYEEELELKRAYEWNNESNRIAYLKFDEKEVNDFTIPIYGEAQYPYHFSYKYPKVGTQNAKVSLWYFDLKTKKNTHIKIPFSYEYIPRIYWNKNEVVAMLHNRHQDTLQLISYNLKTKHWKQLYLETSNQYIDIPTSIQFLTDKSFFILSENDGFNHIYHYDENGKHGLQITNGNFEVSKIYCIDEKLKTIYYQSNEGNEIESAIFSVNYETKVKTKLSVNNGVNDAIFSKDASFFIHTFSSDTIPPSASIVQTSSKNNAVILSNNTLQKLTSKIPKKEFLKLNINENELNAWMIKPNQFDSTKKYPLLMYVYGGPHSQEVKNKWPSTLELFFNFLAEQGYVVACVDNRGTNGKGSVFKKSTFLQLGKLETDDQTKAAIYFGNLPFIDNNKMAIFGWSYGGFMAANCLFNSNTAFKTAIAVAPVTDWNLYDNVYTERYMRTPEENPKGYSQFNPISAAEKLKGNFMLVHGTADENVQLQHSLALIKALNDANKSYRFYIYPDGAHGIGNNKTRYDLYLKMFQYLNETLK
jgi:dipeptidyl-peptidase-4